MATMTFDAFDDQLLKKFFTILPLHQRLRLRPISRRWCTTIDQMSATLTSLKLFGCTRDVEMYRDHLKVVHPDELPNWRNANDVLIIRPHYFVDIVINWLAEHFVSVTHLVVSFRTIQRIQQHHMLYRGTRDIFFARLPLLLNKLQNRLISLTLTGSVNQSRAAIPEPLPLTINFSVAQKILRSVNQMPNLTSLDLLIDNFFCGTESAMNRFNLTEHLGDVLPQLERFSLRDSGAGLAPLRPHFSDAIAALSSKCTRLRLDLLDYYPILSRTLEEHPHLAGNLTHLHLGGRTAQHMIVLEAIRNFSKLEYLFVQEIPTSSSFFPKISHQVNVFTTLRIHSWSCDIHQFHAPLCLCKKLSSVRSLIIDRLEIPDREDAASSLTFCRRLAAWLPELETVNIVVTRDRLVRTLNSSVHHFTKAIVRRIEITQPALDDGWPPPAAARQNHRRAAAAALPLAQPLPALRLQNIDLNNIDFGQPPPPEVDRRPEFDAFFAFVNALNAADVLRLQRNFDDAIDTDDEAESDEDTEDEDSEDSEASQSDEEMEMDGLLMEEVLPAEVVEQAQAQARAQAQAQVQPQPEIPERIVVNLGDEPVDSEDEYASWVDDVEISSDIEG